MRSGCVLIYASSINDRKAFLQSNKFKTRFHDMASTEVIASHCQATVHDVAGPNRMVSAMMAAILLMLIPAKLGILEVVVKEGMPYAEKTGCLRESVIVLLKYVLKLLAQAGSKSTPGSPKCGHLVSLVQVMNTPRRKTGDTGHISDPLSPLLNLYKATRLLLFLSSTSVFTFSESCMLSQSIHGLPTKSHPGRQQGSDRSIR
jgi:hypothetical protein